MHNISAQEPDPAALSQTLQRVSVLLHEALRLLDQCEAPAEIGARLAGVIDTLEAVESRSD